MSERPGLPDSVLRELFALTPDLQQLAYLRVDAAGRVRELGGELARFGLASLEPGASLRACCQWFDEPPAPGESLRLGCVALEGVPHFDVDMVHGPDGLWVILRDASAEAERRARLQQAEYDLDLLRRRLSASANAGDVALDELLRSLEIALVTPDGRGGYVLREPAPSWCGRAFTPDDAARPFVERSEFLRHFIEDAERFWAEGRTGALSSGEWSEIDARGQEWRLVATALTLDRGANALVIRHVREDAERQRRLLQTARERSLQHRALVREIATKEVLLHCIVHDLSGPLSSLRGAVTMLAEPQIERAMTERLQGICQRQLDRLNGRIQQILDVFAAEMGAFEFDDAAAPPRLDRAVAQLVESWTPTFRARGVELRARGIDEPLPVIAETDRLERVISNLVENALRYSRRGAAVELACAVEGDQIALRVEDRGPGVPESARAELFAKLRRGKGKRGRAGLGLYFCRITLERWGGSIVYSPREGGGASFCCLLRRAG